jgi:hypothetical protein
VSECLDKLYQSDYENALTQLSTALNGTEKGEYSKEKKVDKRKRTLMMVKGRCLLGFLWIVAVSVLDVQCASVLRGTLSCEGIQIVSDELTVREAEEYCRYAVSERKKVDEFWGATWKEPIRIHVNSSFRIARSLVPNEGKPGYIEMPLGRVRDNRGALLHEIVHNYTPTSNRFLLEGLAVYLQDRMGGNPAFPNFGENLHVLARDRLSSVMSLEGLNNVRFPQPLSTVMPERTAYILAGSFVGFLIEKYGLPRFRPLYETENYDKVYQKSLRILETEWRASL